MTSISAYKIKCDIPFLRGEVEIMLGIAPKERRQMFKAHLKLSGCKPTTGSGELAIEYAWLLSAKDRFQPAVNPFIVTIERDAFNRGIEVAAQMADLWADENGRMADHTIAADPLLKLSKRGYGSASEIKAAKNLSDRLTCDGNHHAAQFQAARGIAEMIRAQKVKT